MAVRIGKNGVKTPLPKHAPRAAAKPPARANGNAPKPVKTNENAPKPANSNGNAPKPANSNGNATPRTARNALNRFLRQGGLGNDELRLLDNTGEIKSIKEILAIKQQQMELQEKNKTLLPADDVLKRWTESMRLLRQKADTAAVEFKRKFPKATPEQTNWIRAYFGGIADELKRRK